MAVNWWRPVQVLGSQDVPTHHDVCSSSGTDRTQQKVETGTSLSICAWQPVRRAPSQPTALKTWDHQGTSTPRILQRVSETILSLLPWRVAQNTWNRVLTKNSLWDPLPLCGLERVSLEIKILILLTKISDLQLGKVKLLSSSQSISHGQSRKFPKVYYYKSF